MDIGSVENSFTDYFNSSTYADVTLVLHDGNMPAHRMILASKSPVFKAMFGGGFREGLKTEIELKDDNPQAISALISTFYGFSGYLKDAVTGDDDGLNHLLFVIDLFVTAKKYLVEQLEHAILRDFGNMLQTLSKGNEAYEVYLDKVARAIYISHADTAESLREPIVHILGQKVGTLKAWADFKQLLADVSELSYDLVVALAGGGCAKMTLKPSPLATLASGKKRRATCDYSQSYKRIVSRQS